MKLGKSDYNGISATEYEDGSVILRHLRIDKPSGRVIADEIAKFENVGEQTLTPKELLLLAAAELLGRELYGESPVG